jgi:hypothetical protein
MPERHETFRPFENCSSDQQATGGSKVHRGNLDGKPSISNSFGCRVRRRVVAGWVGLGLCPDGRSLRLTGQQQAALPKSGETKNKGDAFMRSLRLSTLALALLAGVTVASAQTVVTPPHGTERHGGGVTFSPEHGNVIRQHATTQHYQSVHEPSFHGQVGATLPGSVQFHSLPDALVTKLPTARQHQYAIVNDRPVIVDPSTRRVIHAFE